MLTVTKNEDAVVFVTAEPTPAEAAPDASAPPETPAPHLRDSTWWKLDELMPPTPPEYHVAMDKLKAALSRADFDEVETAIGAYATGLMEACFVAGWNAARNPETFIFR